MINLLPPEYKEEITYGRRNRSLIGWIITMFAVLIGVIAIAFIGQLYIKSNVTYINKTIESTNARIESQKLVEGQKEAETFASNLKTVNRLLEDQLLFSKIITSLGSVLPGGVTVLNIDFEDSDKALKLQLQGKDEQAVTQGFINLSSTENTLFTKADLENVDCSQEDTCVATVTVLLNKDSDFYFLNSVKKELEEAQNE